MADKMLRMAGRGDDGKAKALKTDNEGNLGVQLTGSNAEQVILWTEQTTSDEKTVDVSNVNTLSFRVDLMEDGMIEVFSENGLPLDFLAKSGYKQQALCERGLYYLNVRGDSSIKIKYTPSYETTRKTTVIMHKIVEQLNIEEKKITRKNPVVEEVTYNNAYEAARSVSYDGNTLYGRRDSLLRKSDDWGATWSTVHDFGTTPNVAIATKSGRLVVVTGADNKVHTSDETGLNFVETLTMTGGSPQGLFGFDTYNDMVFLAEYNTTKNPPTATKVYMSKDAGQTWETVLDVETDLPTPPDAYHMHDVKFDPYEGIIWVVIGDGVTEKMVVYSTDKGRTWHMSEEWGKAPVQATSIIPLPDCVLFVSDSPHTGIARYNRPSMGTRPGQKMTFERALLITNNYAPQGTEVPIAANPVIDFKAPFAVFGWAILPSAKTTETNDLRHADVFATPDGYQFYKIWETNDTDDQTSFSTGVGLDSEGNAVVRIQDPQNGVYNFNTLRLSVVFK